jgi:FixJ family two-component response regulator
VNGLRRRIYLVDDDPSVLKGLSRLLCSAGYKTAQFSSAKQFMEDYDADEPGCLVLDLAMPGFTGLELQGWLLESNSPLPVIFLTGHGDVPTSVRAIKKGAVDFLTKPVNDEELLRAIREALERESASRTERAKVVAIQTRLARLTPREREVMEHVVSGRLNKQIADVLGTALQTVKVHRGRVMRKMGVRSLAELVQLAERVGIGRKPSPGFLIASERESAFLITSSQRIPCNLVPYYTKGL